MSERVHQERPAATALQWLAGPSVWAVHFFLMYGAHTLVCARADVLPRGVWPALVASAGAAALLALAGVVVWCHRRERRPGFSLQVAVALVVLSIAGVVWTTLTTALIAPCAP
jgi:hypothetical protein